VSPSIRRSLVQIGRTSEPARAAHRCTAERVATGSADAAASGGTIRSLMERSHEMKKSSADAARLISLGAPPSGRACVARRAALRSRTSSRDCSAKTANFARPFFRMWRRASATFATISFAMSPKRSKASLDPPSPAAASARLGLRLRDPRPSPRQDTLQGVRHRLARPDRRRFDKSI